MLKIDYVKTLAVFWTIMMSGTAFFTRDNMPLATMIYALIALLLFIYNGIHLDKKNFCILLVVWTFIYINLILNFNSDINNNDFFIYLVKTIAIMLIACLFTKSEYKRSFVDIIVFISTYSLILYLIFVIIGRGLHLPFQELYFMNPERVGEIMRNRGPFWEPGIFQVYINIAVVMILYSKNEIKNFQIKLIILVVALITTFSTTGYLAFAVILSGALFTGFNHSLDKRIIVLLIIAVVALYCLESQYSIIESKLLLGEGSYTDRSNDLEIAIQNVQKNWISGIGLFTLDRTGYTTYNGLLSVAISMGIPGATVYFIFLMRGFAKSLNIASMAAQITAIIAVLIMLSAESIAVFPAFMIYLFSFKEEDYADC